MTRVVVTGAAGFIGSNIIKGLNARGIINVIAVDDLKQGDKFLNLRDLEIDDYLDADDFYQNRVAPDELERRIERLLAAGELPSPQGSWPPIPWPPF